MKRIFFIGLLSCFYGGAFGQVLTYEQSNKILCAQGPPLEITIPNIFTPNGDYKNDNFIPIVENEICIDTYYMAVYNRWGQLLHESRVYSVGWNGNNFYGTPYPEGMYYYTVSYKSIKVGNKKDDLITKKGFFQMVR